jgi:FtsZ-binding cell division protein ZapB
MSNPYNKFNFEDRSQIIEDATNTIIALTKKVDSLQEQNDKLKKEVKTLQWRLHEQD